ncbi:MAG TPA: hypothetical protein DCR20_10280 [Planctomycetaceae bacterium]|nr:hypothetical protein [Planctomycetaceae bacterium]
MPSYLRHLLLWVGCVCLLPDTEVLGQGRQPATAVVPGQRLPDDRPPLDLQRLQASGLTVYRSRHLILVSDAPAEQCRGLPELADQFCRALQQQLGPLATDAAGTEFQVTGYLMDARERFQDAGVLPDGDFVIRHGRHRGYQFWMANQPSDYYRRHLLLHEFVHCYLMCEYGLRDIPPLWYTEGIAEVLATHRLEPLEFGILPDQLNGFEGWGRITELRKRPADNPPDDAEGLLLSDVLNPQSRIFLSDLRYAQAWGLVWLLRNHPELQRPFAGLARVRTRAQFDAVTAGITPAQLQRLAIVWQLMLDSWDEGFDVERSFPPLSPQWQAWSELSPAKQEVEVLADRGWQPGGVWFRDAVRLRLTATGRCVVQPAQGSRARVWESEPAGITIDYAQGRPLGELQVLLVKREPQSLPQRVSVGPGSELSVAAGSELWLRINDFEGQRKGNSGSYRVQLQQADGP